MTKTLRTLLFLWTMVLAAAPIGCGGDSPCELYCLEIRKLLIDNFGVTPERVNCSDGKWKGDCQHCEQLLRDEFEAQSEPGNCERVQQDQ